MNKAREFLALLRSLAREWKWLAGYIRRYAKEVLFYILIGVSGTIMGLGASVASKYLIDAVVAKRPAETVYAGALVIALALVQLCVNAGTNRLSSRIGTRVRSEIRSAIFEHIVYARWEQIRGYHSGDLINRLEGDVATVANGVVSYIPNLVTRLTQFIGCLAIVLYYDPTMAVFALVSAPFMFLSTEVSAKMMRKYNRESREMNGKLLSFSSETIQNLQAIKAFDLTRRYAARFQEMMGQIRRMQLEHNRYSVRLTFCMSLLGLLVSYSCYGWGVWRLWQGAITYGTMTLFIQISGNLTSSFSSLVSLAPGGIAVATAAGRIMEITDLDLERDRDARQAQALAAEARRRGAAVAVRHVTYAYGVGERAVLQDISFRAEPGEVIALVGPSGEGKTTILRLILGLMEPDAGQIEISAGGEAMPVSDSTRRLCAYVPQASTIFSGTIADNLRLSDPDAGEEKLAAALKKAEAWDFVSELPEGMNTNIGERGVNFSEGQIQRISIARALLRGSSVLIMDEATSALDARTEERLVRNLLAAPDKQTCILTTHRPSMLRYCSRVYRLHDNGNLSEETAMEGESKDV